MWVDDFEGYWPKVEAVDDDRLVEIRKKTVKAIDDPIPLIQQPFVWYWEDQLRRIDGEMRRRGLTLRLMPASPASRSSVKSSTPRRRQS